MFHGRRWHEPEGWVSRAFHLDWVSVGRLDLRSYDRPVMLCISLLRSQQLILDEVGADCLEGFGASRTLQVAVSSIEYLIFMVSSIMGGEELGVRTKSFDRILVSSSFHSDALRRQSHDLEECGEERQCMQSFFPFLV